MIDPLEKLCQHDPRNPFHDADDDTAPRDGCACDNCFYGRDQMALEIIRLRETLESIRDTWTEMNDNTHSNTAYALATQALDPEACAEMAKLPWPPDEQIVADLKAIDQSH